MDTYPLLQKIAHRGGAALAPENTLAAFRQALTFPIDAIELDVQMSCDGHAIVFHDATLERVTDGQGNLLDLTLAELQACNAAVHFPGGWPQPQRIPTLREVLHIAQQGRIHVFIEIKASERAGTYGCYPGIVEAVVQEILTTDMLANVMVMSFDWQLLPQVKKLAPGIQTGILVSERAWRSYPTETLSCLVARARDLQCEWIHMDAKLVTSEMPDFFHAHNVRMGVWTVNDLADLRRLAQAGVDALTTDRPDLFASIIDE